MIELKFEVIRRPVYWAKIYDKNLENSLSKVQLFWEGHKNLHNLPFGFEIYLENVKTMRKIVQIFVAFSEKLNFTFKEFYRFLL